MRIYIFPRRWRSVPSQENVAFPPTDEAVEGGKETEAAAGDHGAAADETHPGPVAGVLTHALRLTPAPRIACNITRLSILTHLDCGVEG